MRFLTLTHTRVQWLNVAFLTGRTVVDFVMHWDQDEVPIESFTWTFPIRLFLYLVVLDYLFYVWHRSTHDCESSRLPLSSI